MRNFHSTPYPPPDVVQSRFHPRFQPSFQPPSQTTDPQCAHQSPQQTQHSAPPSPHPTTPSFLIIGLFALRLTVHLLTTLPPYPHRATDISWLTAFLAPYDPSFDLAKIFGPVMQDFLTTYPRILGRMRSQDGFPRAFMRLDPLAVGRERGGMSDGEFSNDADVGDAADGVDERRRIVDFVDAAAEWGSVVGVSAEEVEGLRRVAGGRRVADLEVGRGGVGGRERGGEGVVWEAPPLRSESPLRRGVQDRHVFLGDGHHLRRR